MRVLVTGGAGYLGSVLVPVLLGRGHQVRVLDSLAYGGSSLLPVWSHPAFAFARGDIRDPDLVRSALRGCDAVVHLAAIVGDPACARQPDLARAVNRDAALALLHQSQLASVGRFLFASTCSNYGKMADPGRPVDERSELRPVSLYAETKVAVERVILDRDEGTVATALRFATLYGVSPRMRFDLTVNEFTLELLGRGRLVVFGEQFWRPYLHVADAARAIVLVLEAPDHRVRSEVFNVGGTSENYQKQQLVEMILPYAPTARVEYVHKDEDPRDYRVSFDKIERVMGFRLERRVPDGIREVAAVVTAGLIDDLDNGRYRN